MKLTINCLALFVLSSIVVVADAVHAHRIGLDSISENQRQHVDEAIGTETHLTRLTRSLVYPPTAPTRLQFIGGIGIPVEDLHIESVTSGYVLKAQYFLPEKAEDITHVYLKPQIINGRQFENLVNSSNADFLNADTNNNIDDDDYTSSSTTTTSTTTTTIRTPNADNFKSQHKNANNYRWIIYRGIELVLQSAGLPGRICMLRSICEHAALPLSHESGLLAEILHIIMTPSTSDDALVKHTDQDYTSAEHLGNVGNVSACLATYNACRKSPLDLISTVFDLKD